MKIVTKNKIQDFLTDLMPNISLLIWVERINGSFNRYERYIFQSTWVHEVFSVLKT